MHPRLSITSCRSGCHETAIPASGTSVIRSRSYLTSSRLSFSPRISVSSFSPVSSNAFFNSSSLYFRPETEIFISSSLSPIRTFIPWVWSFPFASLSRIFSPFSFVLISLLLSHMYTHTKQTTAAAASIPAFK